MQMMEGSPEGGPFLVALVGLRIGITTIQTLVQDSVRSRRPSRIASAFRKLAGLAGPPEQLETVSALGGFALTFAVAPSPLTL
jgi:hypothetical protein